MKICTIIHMWIWINSIKKKPAVSFQNTAGGNHSVRESAGSVEGRFRISMNSSPVIVSFS